jgi:lipoprotein-anchoring transpeptidase ErfK/SrfK
VIAVAAGAAPARASAAAPASAGAPAEVSAAAPAAPSAAAPKPTRRARARDPFALTPRLAHIAQVVVPSAVRARPRAGARRLSVLGTEARWGGGPVRLLVLRSARARGGRRWLRVRLHQRPNDRAGWIAADRMRVTRTRWRVVVSTGSRTVTVYRAGRLVHRFGAVVGAASTPTPHGLSAIGERIRQPPGVLGPWALHLTAHSNVLVNYGGGPGRVAIHGRSGALLSDPLGTSRSHGCIRIDNAAVSWLATRAVEGTPVLVRR